MEGNQGDVRVSTALREGTKVVHEQAEQTVIVARILAGVVTRPEYVRLLRALRCVYAALEKELDSAAARDENVRLLHFPRELARTDAISEDIAFHTDTDKPSSSIESDFQPTPAVVKYIERLRSVSSSPKPWLLVAHSYTRHLGDLSGGQILARRIKKIFPSRPSGIVDPRGRTGVSFYTFDLVHDPAGFKTLFRDRMNMLALGDADLALLTEEAVEAFKLNIGLFEEIGREMQLERPIGKLDGGHAHGHGHGHGHGGEANGHVHSHAHGPDVAPLHASKPANAATGIRIAVLSLVVALLAYYLTAFSRFGFVWSA
eukprot:Opistho-2@4861